MAQASGVYSPQRDSIYRRALRQCNALRSGETPGAQVMSDVNDAANAMVAEWQATGLHLWTETEGALFLQPNQISYQLGGTNTDQACLDNSWLNTTSPNGAAQGATTIGLASTAGISSGDNIGVMVQTTAANQLFWTTVNGAPSGGSVTLTAGLPFPCAAGSAVVDYASANKLTRPLRVIDARRYVLASQIDTPLIRMARLDYRDLPNKNTTGTISSFFYDPQLVSGVQWVWPAPPDSLSAVRFTFHQQLGDFVNANDTPDFPQEWTNCITWNLAQQLYPEYGVGTDRAGYIDRMAAKSMDIVTGWDREPESFYLGVNFEQSSR